jgi:hypothetical protein
MAEANQPYLCENSPAMLVYVSEACSDANRMQASNSSQ